MTDTEKRGHDEVGHTGRKRILVTRFRPKGVSREKITLEKRLPQILQSLKPRLEDLSYIAIHICNCEPFNIVGIRDLICSPLRLGKILFTLALIFVLGVNIPLPVAQAKSLNPIQHVVVIMEENHTFDNYFGRFPRAHGLGSSIALPVKSGGAPSVQPFHLQDPNPPSRPVPRSELWLRSVQQRG